jgi:hypothetical protein
MAAWHWRRRRPPGPMATAAMVAEAMVAVALPHYAASPQFRLGSDSLGSTFIEIGWQTIPTP